MVIENIMYFALGFLASALLGLMVMPAIWHRAVRLTKKRIEAATPMTMTEFRADKDQLRAEFALSTRRLELSVESLRKRLAGQLSEINRKKSDTALLKGERDEQLTIVRELEEREAELRRRVLDLEKEGADLAQRLRMRDRQYADKVSQLKAARTSKIDKLPAAANINSQIAADGSPADTGDLLAALGAERQRAAFLEDQVHALIGRVEAADQQSGEASAAIADLRQALAAREDSAADADGGLIDAEARIASAESKLNTLLEETQQIVEDQETKSERLLAEKLGLEEELEHLRDKVIGVEQAITKDWESERLEQSHLRERLNDIASDVSRLVYAVDSNSAGIDSESLFDRVQRFAGDDLSDDGHMPAGKANGSRNGAGLVSDRMAALRDAGVR